MLEPTSITEDEYLEAVDENTGFCLNCRKFTNSCVEPDAEKYKCEECGENAVCGTEQALILGEVTFE